MQAPKPDDKAPKPLKKGEKHKQLKRAAGDPYQSESGTDTGTRKKARKNAPVIAASSAQKPPPSAPSAPEAAATPAVKVLKLKVGSGNLAQVAAKKRARDGLSDNESMGNDVSGGETAAKKVKKINMKFKDSLPSTPAGLAPPIVGPDGKSRGGSRAASPAVVPKAPVSRAASASPAATPTPTGRDSPGKMGMGVRLTGAIVDITPDEVKRVLLMKPEGQELKEFLSHFKGRVGKDNMAAFLGVLRPLSKQRGKLICPK